MNMRCIVVLLLFLVNQCEPSLRGSYSADSYQCATRKLKNGRIRARGRGRIIRYSCLDGYELVGNKYSICTRGSWDTPMPICVSTRCTIPPTPKHAVVGEKFHGAVLMYFCEPGYILVGNSEIYCDGRDWNDTAPYCRDTKTIAPTSCDFEQDDLCWWMQDPKHDFDWIRHRFDTPSSHIGTGPSHDHTLGAGNDGYYLYIEATGRLVNDTARIISPLYSANLTESGCFSFWYHMYGIGIGVLNIYVKAETEKLARLLWTKQGNQGNQWHRGVFDLPNVNSSFQIIMEGVRGASHVSDMAVDDVAILHGDECVVKNATLNTTPASDGDEVEVFNAMQSCRDRCVNTSLETTPSSELYSNPDVCQCGVDCADTSSCCPDYAEYCIYEATNPFEMTYALITTLSTKATTISSPITESPATETIKTHQTENTTRSVVTTVVETMSDATVSTAPTSASTTESPTTLKTTTEFKTSTKKYTKKIVITSPTTLHIDTSSVPALPETTEDFLNDVQINTEAQVFVQDARQLKKTAALNLSGMIGIVIGILTGLVIITTMAVIIFRRRKFYTRNSDGSAFSEDCTVGFLASVETLDFSLARPEEDEKV